MQKSLNIIFYWDGSTDPDPYLDPYQNVTVPQHSYPHN
jgi:hypothetical protein